MIITRAFIRFMASGLAASSLVLCVMLMAPSAEASTSSVTIAKPRVAAALDVSSKGSIVTPTVGKKGKAKITSRSFVITKGGRVVARTSVAGKKVSLGVGSYVVKTTVKFMVGKKKKSSTSTASVTIANSPRMTVREYNSIKTGQTVAQVAGIVGGWGKVTDNTYYPDCDYETGVCADIHEQRREYLTTSSYGFAAVYFTDGRVDEGYFKFYSD